MTRRAADFDPPRLICEAGLCRLEGDWVLRSLRPELSRWRERLATAAATPQRWDCSGLQRLDAVGALLLWRAWGRSLPAGLVLPARFGPVFRRITEAPPASELSVAARPVWLRFGTALLDASAAARRHIGDFLALIGQLVFECLWLARAPQTLPVRELSASLYKVGVTAMPISALVGFLIGVVLSYLSALQLRDYGADVFIVNVLGLGVIRELGPVLVSVLVAGRSGSAITAALGTMRVTEEIDALAVMGVSRHLRLVLPKLLALALAMPLLVFWTSAAALLGGAVVASAELGLELGFFFEALPRVVPRVNLLIGLGKGMVFGVAIGLIACHYGLRVRPNTESLAANTTASVVSAITAVILLDAVIAVLTRGQGLL